MTTLIKKRRCVMKLYAFSSGILKSTKDKFTLAKGIGEPFDIPVPYYFLEVDGAKLLIDAGISPGCVDDPEKTWGDIINVYYPVMKEEEKPVNALESIGVKPDDVDYIIVTHLHLDHAGSLRYFPKAKVIVQLEELRYAFFPDPIMKGAYIDEDIKDSSINYMPIVGMRSMFNGKVFIFPTPGHTPGHQSVLIRLEKHKPVIITGDAIYLRENLEDDVPPGFAIDFAKTLYGYSMIKQLAEDEGAEIWYGHDPESFSEIKLAPHYYE